MFIHKYCYWPFVDISWIFWLLFCWILNWNQLNRTQGHCISLSYLMYIQLKVCTQNRVNTRWNSWRKYSYHEILLLFHVLFESRFEIIIHFHKSYPFPTKYSIEWRFYDTIIIWLYNVYIEHSKNRRNKKSHRYTGESKSRGNNAHYWEQIVHSRTESWEGNTKEIREYSKTCRFYLNILFYQLGLRCKLCWFIFSFFSSFPQFVFIFMLVTFQFEFMLRVEIYVVVVRSGLEWNTY